MSGIVITDADDEVFSDMREEVCPKCGALPKRQELIKGFGKLWKLLCGHCGHEFARGTGPAPEMN